MIRLRLFGLSRSHGDPMAPVSRAPAQVGWESWSRDLELVTPEPLSGRELLARARGVWTVEPEEVAQVVARYGELVVGPAGELMMELLDQERALALAQALRLSFGQEILLVP